MKIKSLFRRVAAGLSAVGLMSGLLISTGVTPVSAAVGPFYPLVNLPIEVDGTAKSFDILDGQTVKVEIITEVTNSWSGWSSNPTVFSMANLSIGTLPADVDVDSTTYYWTATDTSSMSADCTQSANSSVATVSFTLTIACASNIDRVYGQKTITITNNSGIDQTIDTDVENQHLAIGVSATPTTGDMTNLFASVNLDSDSSGVPIPSNASGSANIIFGNQAGTICVDSTVSSGSLDIQRTITLDGISVGTDYASTPYYQDYNGTDSTVSISYPNMGVSRQWGLYFDMPASDGKILIASLDYTLAGVSKLTDSCGGGGGGGGGSTPVQPVIASGAGSLTNGNAPGKGKWSTVKNLPAGMPIPASTTSSTAGPLGDAFYFGLNSSGDAVITRLKKTGATKIGGATTKLTIDLGSGETIRSFGWYGTARDKYAMITYAMGSGFKIYVGNLANANGASSKTIATDQIAGNGTTGLCKNTGTNGSPRIASAPTSAPIVTAYCSAMGMDGFLRYGKVVIGSGAAATITAFDTLVPTDSKPCVYTSAGVNSAATASQNALIIYSANGSQTAEVCAGSGATSRKLITVNTSAVATTKTITTAAFGTTEPSQMVMRPGKTANSWLAVTSSPDTMMGPGAPNKLYTISATGAVAAKAAITLGASQSIFVAPGSGPLQDIVVPVKELANGKWLVYRTQMNFISNTFAIALATVNPANGSFTYGEGVKLTSWLSQFGGAYISMANTTSAGELSFYLSTATGKFKVATWKSFTS